MGFDAVTTVIFEKRAYSCDTQLLRICPSNKLNFRLRFHFFPTATIHKSQYYLIFTYHWYGQASTTFEWTVRNGWDGAAGGARKHHGGQSTVATSLAAWYSRLNRLGRASAHHRGYLSILSHSKGAVAKWTGACDLPTGAALTTTICPAVVIMCT